jgi:hypothetical protein
MTRDEFKEQMSRCSACGALCDGDACSQECVDKLEADAFRNSGLEACKECGRTDHEDIETPYLAECLRCGEQDCPDQEPLHYHHDGCPMCALDRKAA